jgi:hypothetical protein
MKKNYQIPSTKVIPILPTTIICGSSKFLSSDGKKGSLNYIKVDGDAADAASRSFNDWEDE